MNGDEGAGIADSCVPSYADLFLKGVAGVQCSPPPLYYIFQKISIQAMNNFGSDILFKERLVSIFSAIIALFLLFLMIGNYVGWSMGMLSVLIVSQQHNFHYYAVEARPYVLWMACFIAQMFSTLFLWKHWEGINLTKKFMLGICLLLFTNICLVAVAGPGWMQAIVSMGIIFLFLPSEIKKFSVRNLTKNQFLSFFTIVLITVALGLYYTQTTVGCRYEFLQYTMENIEAIYVLFLPWGMGALPLNLFVLLGMTVPFWKRYRGNIIAILGAIALAQLFLAIILIPIVMYKKYYLIARLFLYLSFLRAIFISLGVFGSYQIIEKRIRYLKVAGVIVLALFSYFVVKGIPTRYAPAYSKLKSSPLNTEQCKSIHNAKKNGPLTYAIDSNNTQFGEQTNFVAWMNQQAELCEAKDSKNSSININGLQTIRIQQLISEAGDIFSFEAESLDKNKLQHCGYRVFSY